jgi:tetratricopeptide (TPR) repeat protein
MTEGHLKHGQCLTDETLTDYLEGVLDPPVKAASETHLIACDDCRVKLAFFIRLLRDERQPTEAIAVRTIQDEWVRARHNRRLPGHRITGSRKWKIVSGSVAAALLFALGARVAIDYKGEPETAHEVIHLLLAANRPFEARISDQPHLTYTVTRGPSDSARSSYSLLAGQMNRLSATAYEMGQFVLLQKDFRNAIQYLELASQEAGASAAVHNDLGVAYMESRIDSNQSKAIAEFRRALAAQPDFLPAAFNLAVLYERMGRNEQAEAQWMQYIELETDDGWKSEARSRLEGITR